jgi:hypothetical protein
MAQVVAMASTFTIAHILHLSSRSAFPSIDFPICDSLAPLYLSTISNTKNMRLDPASRLDIVSKLRLMERRDRMT